MVSISKTGTAALFNPWHYLGLFLIVIFLFMFAIGYFFNTGRSINPGRHGKKPTLYQNFLSFIPFCSPKRSRRYIK